jgi:hypothetical protein
MATHHEDRYLADQAEEEGEGAPLLGIEDTEGDADADGTNLRTGMHGQRRQQQHLFKEPKSERTAAIVMSSLAIFFAGTELICHIILFVVGTQRTKYGGISYELLGYEFNSTLPSVRI